MKLRPRDILKLEVLLRLPGADVGGYVLSACAAFSSAVGPALQWFVQATVRMSACAARLRSPQRSAPAPVDRSWTHSTVRLKTYIVEDNATIRENLIGALEELTCLASVGSAETELEACTWLTANRDGWDLIILDLFLRQGTGLGILAVCKQRKPHQKVIVLSNYATADIRERCRELGVDEVFDKSKEIDGLVAYCLAHCTPSNS